MHGTLASATLPVHFLCSEQASPVSHPSRSSSRVGVASREAGSRSSRRRASFPLRAGLAVPAADAHRPLPVRWGIAGGREGFPVSQALRTAPAALQTLQRRGLKAAAQIRAHFPRNSAPPLPTRRLPAPRVPQGPFGAPLPQGGSGGDAQLRKGWFLGVQASCWGLCWWVADLHAAMMVSLSTREARAGLSADGSGLQGDVCVAAVEPEASVRLE